MDTKNRIKYRRVLLCLTLAFIFTLGILFIFLPKGKLSIKENRELAPIPKANAEALLDGKFAQEANLYISDHFPARNEFIAMHTLTEIGIGKRESNGVILTDEGALCLRNSELSKENEKSISNIKDFLSSRRSKGERICIGAIPEQADVYEGSLPLFYKTERGSKYDRLEGAFGSRIYCDFWSLFKGRGSKVYYKSDHHWNSDGAYEAYLEVSRVLGITPYTDFKFITATDDFSGSAAARFGIDLGGESITIPRFNGDEKFIRSVNGHEYTGLYDFDRLNDDKYSLFLGGNAGLTEIYPADEEKRNIRPKMLIFGDSYIRSIAPYLIRHFDLILCDPRYVSGFADEVADNARADYTLVLMSYGNLCGERSAEFFALP